VVEAVAAGRLHLDRIITQRAGWNEAATAVAAPAVKLLIERGS
jgi:hypothetical protein